MIPPGTIGFTLEGAGSKLTLLTAPAGLPYPFEAIQAGQLVELNNWPITSKYPVSPITGVVTGQTALTLTGAANPFAAGDYAMLYDLNKVVNQAGQGQYNRAELVKILSVSGMEVTIDKGAAREYNLAPALCGPLTKVTSSALNFKGIGFDGTVPAGMTFASGYQQANGILEADLTDGLTCSDLAVSHYATRAVETDVIRNFSFSGCSFSYGANPGDPGDGYGLTLCRSRFGTVTSCTGSQTRHALICTNGTTDVAFSSCTLDTTATQLDDFNTHGFDERRISWTGCRGGINIGNPAWLGGGQGFSITNCQTAAGMSFGPNVTAVTVTGGGWDVYSGPINLYSSNRGTGSPSSGYPDQILFKNLCIVDPRGNGVLSCGQVGKATFSYCQLIQQSPIWGNVLKLSGASGNLVFDHCKLVNNSLRSGDSGISLGANLGLSITCTNDWFISCGGAPWMIANPPGSGALALSGCTSLSLGVTAPALAQNPTPVTAP